MSTRIQYEKPSYGFLVASKHVRGTHEVPYIREGHEARNPHSCHAKQSVTVTGQVPFHPLGTNITYYRRVGAVSYHWKLLEHRHADILSVTCKVGSNHPTGLAGLAGQEQPVGRGGLSAQPDIQLHLLINIYATTPHRTKHWLGASTF